MARVNKTKELLEITPEDVANQGGYIPTNFPDWEYDGPIQFFKPSVAGTLQIGCQVIERNVVEDCYISNGTNPINRNFGIAPALQCESSFSNDLDISKMLMRFSNMLDATNIEDLLACNLVLAHNGITTITAGEIEVYWVSNANGDWVQGAKNNAAASGTDPSWNAKSQSPLVNWAGSAGLSTPTTDHDPRKIGSLRFVKSLTPRQFVIPLNIEIIKEIMLTKTVNSGFLIQMKNAVSGSKWNQFFACASLENNIEADRPKLQLIKASDPTTPTGYKCHITPDSYAIKIVNVNQPGAKYVYGDPTAVGNNPETNGIPLEKDDELSLQDLDGRRITIYTPADTGVWFAPIRAKRRV